MIPVHVLMCFMSSLRLGSNGLHISEALFARAIGTAAVPMMALLACSGRPGQITSRIVACGAFLAMRSSAAFTCCPNTGVVRAIAAVAGDVGADDLDDHQPRVR